MPFSVEFKIIEYADAAAANAGVTAESGAGWSALSIARGAVAGYAVLYRRDYAL